MYVAWGTSLVIWLHTNPYVRSHRYLLQLHHVHGGLLGGVDHPHPQLSSQERRHSRDVAMGKDYL